MFDALEVSLQALELIVPLETRIKQRSRALGQQIERATDSIAMNLGEGAARRDGDKRRHYEMAAGSTTEITVALRIAVVRRYITAHERAEVEQLLDRVRAMLWRLTH